MVSGSLDFPSFLGWVVVIGCVLLLLAAGTLLQAAFTVGLEKHVAWKFGDALKFVFHRMIVFDLGTFTTLAAIWVVPPLFIKFPNDEVGDWQFLATAAILIIGAILYYYLVIAKIRLPPTAS
ncbi:MAG: hypothetical protein K8S25_12080 [Alphaproteobacteria bacterium]|nr:hypothetical protein [Alphaproteobacteria bacterium]